MKIMSHKANFNVKAVEPKLFTARRSTIADKKRGWAKRTYPGPQIIIWNLFFAQEAIFISSPGPRKFFSPVWRPLWMVRSNVEIPSKSAKTGLENKWMGDVVVDTRGDSKTLQMTSGRGSFRWWTESQRMSVTSGWHPEQLWIQTIEFTDCLKI